MALCLCTFAQFVEYSFIFEFAKFRFGDKLSYELDVDESCENINIPKLTVVTFVENACIHGIENKTTRGWIFVRIYMEEKESCKALCIEVEDTGTGMEESEQQKTVLDDAECKY